MKITDEQIVANILRFNKEVTELNVKYSERIEELYNENDRLHSIIKEVREYIENTPKIVSSIHLRNKESNFAFIEKEIKKELLEILDKESDK